LGKDYIKKGTKKTYGRVQFDDGVVVRTKTAKYTKYELDSAPDPLDSFGAGVPDQVLELFNMGDVNFQTQHGSFFLLQDAPGQVASYIRFVTGLYDLTFVADDITSRLRSAKASLSGKKQEIEELQEELERLEQLDVERLEYCIQKYREVESKNEVLRTTKRSINRIVERLWALEEAPTIQEAEVFVIFSDMDALVQEGIQLDEKRFDLQNLLDKIGEVSGNQVVVRDGLFEAVELAIRAYQKNCGGFSDLDDVVKRLTALNSLDSKDGTTLKEARAEERKLLEQLVDCPHCGSELTQVSREKLIGENQ
jgi:hypothetical protein